jgi:hypothetical protein
VADSFHHAVSSARQFGGVPENYAHVHRWFDGSKEYHGDFRHRFLRHHLEGVARAIEIFGDEDGSITNSDGRKIPVRWIGEQHLREDFNGYMPRVTDWAEAIQPAKWMSVPQKLSRQLEQEVKYGRPDQFGDPPGTPDPEAVKRLLNASMKDEDLVGEIQHGSSPYRATVAADEILRRKNAGTWTLGDHSISDYAAMAKEI